MKLKTLAGAALGALLLIAGTASRAQNFAFTMAVIPAPSDPYSVLSAKVPERIAKATNGRVKITVNDSLIPGTQIVSAVRDGRVEMSAALHSYLTAEEPRFGIFNLPGLIEGMDDYIKVGNAFWFEDTHKIWKDRYKSVVLAEGAWCTRACSRRRRSARSRTSRTSACVSTTRRPPNSSTRLAASRCRWRCRKSCPRSSAASSTGCSRRRATATARSTGASPRTCRIGPSARSTAGRSSSTPTPGELPPDLQNSIKTEMLALQKEALGEQGKYTKAAHDNMKANGATLWTAPTAERKRLFDPKYVQPSYDAWISRAKEVGFDGNAYLAKVRSTLGR